MGLAEYNRKRNFGRTSEPPGKKAGRQSFRYLIQKHAASHLHYDFRLELDGVLKSWAVPKGPSLDPSVKRLAMHVEDHPVAYGDFEGIIPQGQYGGGTVMLWDRGHWQPLENPHKGYRQGRLHFELHGEKLKGAWYLVRGGGKYGVENRQWLLFKGSDTFATARGDILKRKPLSAVTGRSLDEIAADKTSVWQSNKSARASTIQKPAKPVKQPRKKPTKTALATRRGRRPKLAPQKLTGARKAALPSSVIPQLATLTKDAPEGDEWLHEMKFDGYRMLCRIDGRSVELMSRNEKSWTHRLDFLARAARKLPVKQALLDGEVVALEPSGISSFQTLQNVFLENRSHELVYFVFDLLHLNGYDVRKAPLEERKELLGQVLAGGIGPFRPTDHIVGSGPEFFAQACKIGLEGIISKRRARPYISGRTYDWIKVKCIHTDEFVIGGYTDPAGARTSFGALLVGVHDGGPELRYAGKVGTGFNNQMLIELLKKLRPLEQPDSPFSDLTRKVGVARTAHWVSPKLVAQIAFSEWTRDGRLRHPSFQGLREDKRARSVVRDVPQPVEKVVRASRKGAKAKRKR